MQSLFPLNIGDSYPVEAKFKVLSSPPIAYLELSKPLVQNLFRVFVEFAKKMEINEEIQEPPFLYRTSSNCIGALGSNVTIIPPEEFTDQILEQVKQEYVKQSERNFCIKCISIHQTFSEEREIEKAYITYVKIDNYFQRMRQNALGLKKTFLVSKQFSFVLGVTYRSQLPKIEVLRTKYFHSDIIKIPHSQREALRKITRRIKNGKLTFLEGEYPYLFLSIPNKPVKLVHTQLKLCIPDITLPPRFEDQRGIGAHMTLISTAEFLANPSLQGIVKAYMTSGCDSIPISCSGKILEIKEDLTRKSTTKKKFTSVWDKISHVWALAVTDRYNALRDLRALFKLQPFPAHEHVNGLSPAHITVGVRYFNSDFSSDLPIKRFNWEEGLGSNSNLSHFNFFSKLESTHLFDEELSQERGEIEAILCYYAREDQVLEELKKYPVEAFTPEHQDIALGRQWHDAFLFMTNDASISYISLKRHRAQKKKSPSDDSLIF